MTIIQLQASLLSYFDDKEEYSKENYLFVNNDYYTLADLIARQYINNGCDGFGMVKVHEAYRFVVNNLEHLKTHNMISETATNNFGITLWENWGIQ